MNAQFILQAMLSKGVGNITLKRIISALKYYDGTTELLCEDPARIKEYTNLNESLFDNIRKNKEEAASLIQKLERNNIGVITEDDDLYPQSLKKNLGKSCPAVLFVKGNTALLHSKAVGFCGSRKASPKGLCITEQCVSQLIKNDITIISGYASGTDITAHLSALRNGGKTIFVLAEGLLKSKEKEVIKDFLTERNHLFISQFLPTMNWSVGNAMSRNGIIIGLSKVMILIESGRTGGTYAAGQETLRRNIPLYVVDYEKPAETAEANAYFISKGGYPIRGKDGVPVLNSAINSVYSDRNSVIEQIRMF